MSKFLIELAEREIESRFGDRVSVYDKAKTLLKFGRNADLGTSIETVWESGGDETYATGNDITHVSSSSASDTATVMYVEGHTVTGTGAGTKLYFRATTVTLNGQNKVELPYGFARVSRAYVQSGTLAGDFYVFEDDTLTAGVPDTAANVHITVQGASGDTQSFKAATSFSNNDYAIITGGYFGIDKKQAASADFVMEVRQAGGVFRPAGGRISLNSAGLSTVQIQFAPYVIAPKNSDIRIRAVSSAAGTEVDASFQCFLAKVKG